MSTPRAALPLLTVDLDGVICAPLFGVNLGIALSFLDAEAPPPRARVPPRWFSAPLDQGRFALRRPLPGVAAALTRLREVRRVVLLTGRRSSPRRWLRQHGLEALLDEVVVNETALPSAHYKLQAVARLGAAEHIDDDPRTVQLLAESADSGRSGDQRPLPVPYLREWPRSRGLLLDGRVRRVRDLGELAALLAGGEAGAR